MFVTRNSTGTYSPAVYKPPEQKFIVRGRARSCPDGTDFCDPCSQTEINSDNDTTESDSSAWYVSLRMKTGTMMGMTALTSVGAVT
jgi:hypothetical protein